MQRISLPFAAIVASVVLAITVGCQLPQNRSGLGFRSEGKEGAPLTNQQVAEMQLALGRSMEQKGDYERALDAYAQAAEANPKFAPAYWRQGVVHDKQGNNRESEAFYKQAVKLDDKNPDLLCDYGYSLYLQRRWGESEALLRQSVKQAPKHARSHTNLGLVCAQTDREQEALAEFHMAGCDESDANSNLALVMALNHRNDDALRAYQTAQAARRNSEVAKKGIAALNNAAKQSVQSKKSDVQLASHTTEDDAPPKLELAESPAKANVKRNLTRSVTKPVMQAEGKASR